MNRDDIIRMAREAGSIDSEEVIETVWNAFAAAERKRFIRPDCLNCSEAVCESCDAAIRARGDTNGRS